MIDYKYGDLFLKNSIDKQIVIADDAGAVKITNKELYSQKFEITETLCSEEQLVFGSCEASVLKFTAANIFTSLKGKWVNVKMTMGGNTDVPLSLGRFKVESDKPTADRKKREYVAYDALYDVINTDVAGWYNTILPEKTSTTTMRQFRDSFFEYFDIEQEEITLINDTVTVKKTIEPESLSGKDVLFAICEINGCFGKMSREGKFRYVYLVQAIEGIYPSHDLYPSEDLYPGASKTRLIGSGLYIPPCVYEDYIVESISGLVIRKEEEDIGSQTGDMSNAYIIQDNFLVYGKSADELSTIGERIFEKIKSITYKPFSTKAKGNPCIEVGDAIRISTSLQKIETYVLQRTLSGIQAMRDTYSAEGEQKRDQKVNDISRSIVELKGKTNVLIRTVDETRSELADLEFDTETRFLQTADEISAEARRAQAAEAALSLRADEIAASVSDLDDDLTAKINLNAEEIAAEVKRADAAEAALSLRADEIAASVSDLDDEVTAEIKALSGQISLKVESDEVQSMIDISLEDITITADQIRLEGYTSINGGFQIFSDGSAMISSSDGEYWCEVGTYGLNVYRTNSDFYSGTRDDGFFLYDYYDNTYSFIWYSASEDRFRVGHSGGTIPCYLIGDRLQIAKSATVNGYTVITAGNIDSYVSSTVPDDISVDSITGNDDYSSIVIALGSFQYAFADVLDAFEINLAGESLGDIIADIQGRLEALEG